MSRIRSRALLVVALSSSLTSLAIADTTFATTTPPDEASATAPPPETSSSDDLDALLVDALGEQDGGIAVLSIRDGETTTAVVGNANAAGDPIVADTPFRIGAPTAMFVAAIVMQLVDEGLVELDEPLSTYLPDTPIGGDVPIAYLLGHRSGLPNPADQAQYSADVHADLAREFTPAEVLAYIEDVPVVGDPGAQLSLSTANYILLGQLIEAVDGADLNTVLQRRIAEPLGLDATSFETADTPKVGRAGRRVVTYGGRHRRPNEPYTSIATSAWASGAMISTTSDIATFLNALFDGEVVSDEALDEMTTLGPEGYGLGIFTYTPSDGTLMWGTAGFIIGYTAGMVHDPLTDDTLVVLTNNEQVLGPDIGGQIIEEWWLDSAASATTAA